MTQDFETPDTTDPIQETPITSDDFASVAGTFNTLGDELRELNLAVEIYPEAAVNFAARGDYYRRTGERDLAVSDYQRALMLADADLARGDWAFVSQAVRDRLLIILAEMGAA